MNTIGIIPARMASTRFPGKPMASICGIPMIGHCYLRSKFCEKLDEIYVATCDEEIYNYITKNLGGKAVLTLDSHERAAERAAEALKKIEKIENKSFDIVVMIQGDEPLLNPYTLSRLISPFEEKNNYDCINLMSLLPDYQSAKNPNNVKVVTNKENLAVYYSREPIPSKEKFKGIINYYKQLGLMSFTRNSLLEFIEMKPSQLEQIESVDLNRLIENRYKVLMLKEEQAGTAVDNPEDIILAEKEMSEDSLFYKYQNES